MMSSVEAAIKTENELPLNLKTQESPNFQSTTPPSSPNLSQVPEHILLAVNSMNNAHNSPTITSNSQNVSINSSIANSLANSIVNSLNASVHQPPPSPPNKMCAINSMASSPPMTAMNPHNRMASPVMSYANSMPASTSANMVSTGYIDHNGQSAAMPSPNGGFARKSPPNLQQSFNHLTNHVTSLPSSIGRLTLGLGGHYAPSPIHEQHEEMHSPVSSGGGMSPPLSPPQAASPPPTMVPPSGGDRLPSVGHGSSPSSSSGNGGLSNLHHALHGLHNLHNLHNLHSLQNLQTQMAALASLQGGIGNTNPSVSSLLHSHLAAQHSESLNSPVNNSSSPQTPSGQSGNVPQMVLTAGSVPQSVQGAQLLIPTSQGIAVQPILTIPLGQAGPMSGSSIVNSLSSFPPFQNQSPHQQQHHHQSSHAGSSASSPLPTSSNSASSSPHPLLGLAGLPPSLFHPHAGHNNNNNSTSNNNNNIISQEKTKLPLPMSSPAQDAISGLGARLGGGHYTPHHMPPPSRYSPDFLDTHNQPTINQTTGNVVDGVNLDEIKEFAKAFKIRRLSLGLTQTQVGQALSITEGPAYSQSAICRFEKLDITPKSAQKIKPVLERWMQEAEDRYKNGQHTLTDYMGNEPSKKRKRRTSFTPQALEVLNAHFERNTHPSGAEITALAEQLGYEREVVRIWFCNKRQALKNTVRMMAKPHPPPPPPPPTHQMN